MEIVQLFEQRKKKKKGEYVVQSIEWQTFNCLNNVKQKRKMCCSINLTENVQFFE